MIKSYDYPNERRYTSDPRGPRKAMSIGERNARYHSEYGNFYHATESGRKTHKDKCYSVYKYDNNMKNNGYYIYNRK